MSDLGNRASSMRVQCKHCGWTPPESMTMQDAQLHFQVEHDTDEVKLDLVVICSCGAVMADTESRPWPTGGVKDYFSCGACGNTGYVRRDEP